MAEVVRYVDPDATGGTYNGLSWATAYQSLSAWEAAEQTDLPTDGDWHHVYVRSSGGTADTTKCTVSGWTTDATHYILIEAASGDEAVKTGWDTSRYRLQVTDDEALQIAEDYVRVDGLQIGILYSAGGADYSVYIFGLTNGANDVRIQNCYIKGTGDTSANDVGIRIADSDGNLTVTNTVIFDTDREFLFLDAVNTATIAQCAFANNGNYYGIHVDEGTNTFTNIAVFGSLDDFKLDGGTNTIDYCASDDGDGTNAVAASGSDWDNEYNDPDNGDFTLLNSGNCYHGGTTGTGVSTDMEGDSYDASNPSIGVDEYVAAGGGVAPTGALSGPLGGPLAGVF